MSKTRLILIAALSLLGANAMAGGTVNHPVPCRIIENTILDEKVVPLRGGGRILARLTYDFKDCTASRQGYAERVTFTAIALDGGRGASFVFYGAETQGNPYVNDPKLPFFKREIPALEHMLNHCTADIDGVKGLCSSVTLGQHHTYDRAEAGALKKRSYAAVLSGAQVPMTAVGEHRLRR